MKCRHNKKAAVLRIWKSLTFMPHSGGTEENQGHKSKTCNFFFRSGQNPVLTREQPFLEINSFSTLSLLEGVRSLQISSVEWGVLLPGPRPHGGDAHSQGNCAVCVTMLRVLSKACPQYQNHLRLSSPSCRARGTSQWDRWWSLWETCFLNHSWSRISGSVWMELYLRAKFYLELSSRSDITNNQGSLVNH